MATNCASRTRISRRPSGFAPKRPERFFRPVLERLEERTLLSGPDTQPPIVLMAKPMSHDPNHPDIVSPAIEVLARASDQATGNSGIDENGFGFEVEEKPWGAATFGPWLRFDGFGTQVNSTPGGTTVTTLFRGIPNYVYGFRVSATDGAGNKATSDVTFAMPVMSDIDPDIIIIIDNVG